MDATTSNQDEKPAVSLFCPSCNNVIKHPRILPCLHSLCTACINSHLNGHYKCPVCGELTNGICSFQDVDRLPVDSLLESVLDMVALHSGKDIPCDVCDDSQSTSAVSRCMTCALYLCTIHCDAHKTAKHSKGHEVTDLSLLRDCPLGDLRRPLYCVDHVEEFLSLYCETRDKPVCKHCCLLNKDHLHISLDQAIYKYNKEIKNMLKRAQTMSKSLEKMVSDLELVVANVNSKAKSIMGEIDVIFDYQINNLLKRKKELRNKVQDIRRDKTQALEQQQETIKDSLKKLHHACKFTTISVATSISHNNPTSLVLKNFLVSRLWSFLDRESFLLKPAEDSFLEVLFDDSLLHNAIETFGALGTRYVCPPQCTARGAGIHKAYIGESNKFSIFLLDQFGNKLNTTSKVDVHVDLFNQDGSSLDITYLIDKNDGTFEVSYMPLYPGILSVVIRIQEKDIKDSPFKVQVSNEMRKSWI